MKLVLVLMLLALFLPAPAQAETVTIVKTVTPVALGNACSNAGGTFTSYESGYSCRKENCDGKGGQCQVDCTSAGQCIGSTPPQTFQSTGMTLLGILQGGDMVFHAPKGGAVGSMSSQSSSTAGGAPPPVIY